jgi:carboxypeptidase Q
VRSFFRLVLSIASVLVLGISLAGAQEEPIHWDVIARIREEGFQRSQVMDIAGYMTDVLGPRLTSSRRMKKAQAWAKSKMEDMGLAHVIIEPFAEHEASWDNVYTSLHLVEPDYQPLIGYPYAFTPGTDGKITAEARIAVIRNRSDLERFKGKLRGFVVLTDVPRDVSPRFEADASRLSEDDLHALEQATIDSRYGADGRAHLWDPHAMSFVTTEKPGSRPTLAPTDDEVDSFANEVQAFYKEEGVAAVVDPARGRDGTVFIAGRPGSRYDRSLKGALAAPARIALAPEHYNRIYRLVERGMTVKLELEVRNVLDADDPHAYNVLGELPGSDLGSELVMAGGHFDSWHSGTGATDDASGCAVVLEAVRILEAIGVKPRRTIRVALWSWEEGGKVGSRRYVQEHFGPSGQGAESLSVYFNVDNGTGQFRGLYLQGNEPVRRIFESWMAPFADLRMTSLTIDHTFGVDVEGFDLAGLPAFQFIQDPLDYDSRTHHSNMDVYDRLAPADMRKNAVILASFLYHAAMRDEKLPREKN